MSLSENHGLRQLQQLYKKLLKKYGWQKWWYSRKPFEIIVGAILVQNTSWTNVDKALCTLKERNLLSPKALINLPTRQLASYIKVAGLYNQKVGYLKNFSRWFLAMGGFKKINKMKTSILRESLLSIKGIGKETADVILLYVFHRPIFVIDRYTQRLLIQQKIIKTKWKYDDLQALFHRALPNQVKIFSEYHALIVFHGKKMRKEPSRVGS